MSTKSHRSRVRRHRRLESMRLRTGKPIVSHKSKSGRTGKVRSTRLKGHD